MPDLEDRISASCLTDKKSSAKAFKNASSEHDRYFLETLPQKTTQRGEGLPSPG
jgi:hypothetical protein